MTIYEEIQPLIDDPTYGIVGAIIETDMIVLLVDMIRPKQDDIPKFIDGLTVIISVGN